MTRVKVCGVTSEHDAALVAAAGASAVGMIFWPGSPRAVTPAQARQIVAALPPFVQAVGVFVDVMPAEAHDAADRAGLDILQLHGNEHVDDWASSPWPIIKALTLATYAESRWVTRARAVLLDAHDPVRRGGTGRAIDWCETRRLTDGRPFVLAGGLTADNVAQAIAEARPMALDVASGVEHSAGRKDPARVRAFFAAVQRADDLQRHLADAAKGES